MTSTTSTSTPAPLRISRSFLLGAGALVTVAMLAGCQPDTGPGTVVVSYQLGNNKTCSEVGVDEIRAAVFQGSYEEPTVLFSDIVPCSDGEVVLNAVEPNTYELRVIGYDQNGVATFDNLGQIAAERRIEVFEAAESPIEAELTARPAELYVRWRLGDGGFSNCGNVGIDRFEITTYQVGGGTALLEATLPCNLAGDGADYRPVPDPDRSLNGVLFGEAGIQALDANGMEVGSPALFVFEPPGSGYSIDLTIECTDAGCSPVEP